jgi:hypothetical protein
MFVDINGKPIDLRQKLQDGYKQRYLERKAGVVARKPTVKNGYAAPPGTGPEGKTCRDCAHKLRLGNFGGKSFLKCDLRRATWTGGEGTDILARSPACSKFSDRAALPTME